MGSIFVVKKMVPLEAATEGYQHRFALCGVVQKTSSELATCYDYNSQLDYEEVLRQNKMTSLETRAETQVQVCVRPKCYAHRVTCQRSLIC